MVYGRYTDGIRWYREDIRGYTGIYGDIRGYTQYIVSIAYIGYTGMYGWYTGGIRVVYGASSEIKFSYVCMFDPQKNGTSIEINLLSIIFPLNLKGEAKISTEINARSSVFRFNNLKEK